MTEPEKKVNPGEPGEHASSDDLSAGADEERRPAKEPAAAE